MKQGSAKFRRKRPPRASRAGNAGIIASFGIALVGVAIGGLSAYVSELGAAASAAKTSAVNAPMRDDPLFDGAFRQREEIVQRVLAGVETQRPTLERLTAPRLSLSRPQKPKIIIIFDDMGLDRPAFEKTVALPGPITLSILPYAKDADALASSARAQGREVMLHLPMEPEGKSDPGPKALRTDMTGAAFVEALKWNLARFDGYAAVNNHMGSKLTADEAAMKTVLAYLNHQDLFFVDSVTTGDTVVRRAAQRVGANVFSRDVFLDAEINNKAAIRKQLALVERIARETGYAVAIGHPRKETLEVLGPWLTSAPERGFELAPVTALVELKKQRKQETLMSLAPSLRL